MVMALVEAVTLGERDVQIFQFHREDSSEYGSSDFLGSEDFLHRPAAV
jgi:hypothetical protein